MTYRGLRRVISGGQTGADQAGLIAAHKIGLATGGTAPSGWYTEAGPNPLLELLGLKAAGSLRSRTIQNVKDADATLLLSATLDSPGSMLTRNEALRQGRPFMEHDLTPLMAPHVGQGLEAVPEALLLAPTQRIMDWLITHHVEVLNVAGNRERHKDLRTTRTVELILTQVLQAMHLEGLLVLDADVF